MRKYDSSLPLIFIHVPKAAGTSTGQFFQHWFGDGFIPHYFDESAGKMPVGLDLVHAVSVPVVVYGHFNRARGFGVENSYPEVQQFVTILRDPFERAVSGYFYVRKRSGLERWKDLSRVPSEGLRNHLVNYKGRMLNHFPCIMTLDNYKEVIETSFVEVGVVEYLGESMSRIAGKLGKVYDSGALDQLNVTERSQCVPYELREAFIEQHELEYAVYNYVLAKYV